MDYILGLAARGILYAPSYSQHTHTIAFVTPVLEHWLERKTTQIVHNEVSIRLPAVVIVVIVVVVVVVVVVCIPPSKIT